MPIIAAVQGYDLNIGVGQAQAIDVAGDRVHFISAVDPFAVIELRPNFSQGNITLKPGQGYRFAEQVTRWVVYNKGTVALSGSLMIGTGDFFDQRISGEVSVIDGGKARSLGNTAFIASGASGAVAGQYSRIQLWNPVGSSKRAVIENLVALGADANTAIIATTGTVALATLIEYGQPKLLGGAQSVMEFRKDSTVTPAPAAPSNLVLGGVGGPSILQSSLKPVQPFVVPPGYGFIMNGAQVNNGLSTGFEWYEEVI